MGLCKFAWMRSTAGGLNSTDELHTDTLLHCMEHTREMVAHTSRLKIANAVFEATKMMHMATTCLSITAK